MANEFIVITAASGSNKLMPSYVSQLQKSGIPHHIEPITIGSSSDGKLGWCINLWRKFANNFSSYNRLILTDAWDVLCYGTREQIEENLKNLHPFPVFAAERNCYPEPHLAESINIPRPWCFVNGGMLTSSPADLIDWCDRVERHPQYDPNMIGQQWLNRRLAENDPLVKIDWETILFYCMYLEYQGPAIENQNGRPFNTLCETFPSFIHFNGSCDWNLFLEMMNG